MTPGLHLGSVVRVVIKPLQVPPPPLPVATAVLSVTAVGGASTTLEVPVTDTFAIVKEKLEVRIVVGVWRRASVGIRTARA